MFSLVQVFWLNLVWIYSEKNSTELLGSHKTIVSLHRFIIPTLNICIWKHVFKVEIPLLYVVLKVILAPSGTFRWFRCTKSGKGKVCTSEPCNPNPEIKSSMVAYTFPDTDTTPIGTWVGKLTQTSGHVCIYNHSSVPTTSATFNKHIHCVLLSDCLHLTMQGFS